MSFGDPRREAAQAGEMLVHGVDANEVDLAWDAHRR
jgi:hypothetical protein